MVKQAHIQTNAGQHPAAEGYWFDAKAADNACAYFPRYLRLTTAEWAGKPFKLEKWQAEDIIRPAFGWKRKDGTRQYRRVVIWIPRKNGKTELAAGVAHIMLVGDGEPGAQVLSIATDKDQASIVFDKATAMVELNPELRQWVTPFKSALYCPQLAGSFKPLAGIPRGKHGLNMSGMVGDEVHEWAHDRLYQYVHQSSAARRQPLEFLISTAGEMRGYGYELWKECLAILAGDIVDHATLVVIYGADPDADKADPDYWKRSETWQAANPNYGVSVKPEYLAEECRKAQRLPRLENDFKRFHLGLWVEQVTRWLPMDAWADCGAPLEERAALRKRAEDPDDVAAIVPTRGPAIFVHRENERWKALPELMKGRRAFAGIDLASTTDLTALVWVFPPLPGDNIVTVVPKFYVPRETLKRRVKTDKVAYDTWERQGALITTPGNAVDYAYLKRDLFDGAEVYRLEKVAIDRWNATQISIEIADEGIAVEPFGQGFASMSAPSKELEKLLLGRMLDHGGHPVLTWNARNAAVKRDEADNIKPDKDKSTERIDGIVAEVMGLGVMMQAEPEQNLDDFLKNTVRV